MLMNISALSIRRLCSLVVRLLSTGIFSLAIRTGISAAAEKPPMESQTPPPTGHGHVFAWPFAEWESMQPRGGTTTGADVTLLNEAAPEWLALAEDGLDSFERDRRAILAMAGEFRVSFDFVEVTGSTPDYQPQRPYFSWGTEFVKVLSDTGQSISLQHALVMFMKGEDGSTEGPFVMKHWRQDWTWQDSEIFAYESDLTWRKQEAVNPTGRWSQAVFQVDDSPRYEVMGAWRHVPGASVWRSDSCPRPLPRREFSARDDYQVLDGYHEITIYPTGWLHTQSNRKMVYENHLPVRSVGTELGVDRYERITAPDLATPFNESWTKTAEFWAEVRATWAELQERQSLISLEEKVDGKMQFAALFEQAARIEAGSEASGAQLDENQQITPISGAAIVRKYLRDPEKAATE